MVKKKASQKIDVSSTEEQQLKNEETTIKEEANIEAKKETIKDIKNEETAIEKEVNIEVKKETIKDIKNEKYTLCYLASKANYIIEVQYNNQITFIQPFGKIKVIKEKIKINANDAKHLTFIKI